MACSSGAKTASTSPVPLASPTAAQSTVSPGTAAVQPALGRSWSSGQKGYGEVRPSEIFNGGDPTGLVDNITWESWGGARAIGHGTSTYVAPYQSTAQGTQETATVVAFDLGSCSGTLMYRAVEWYFPQHGGEFDLANYTDICKGQFVTPPPIAPPTVPSGTFFHSPSGNIHCVIGTEEGMDYAECQILDFTYKPPPRPASCPTGDYGDVAAVNPRETAFWYCGRGPISAGTVLPYGHKFKVGTVVCDSEKNDMMCSESPSGHFFVLSREGYQLS